MKQNIILCVGVSGSGKTTWTSDYIKNHPNTLRINRDDIRKTLVGNLDGYYQRKDLNALEQMVNEIEESLFFSMIINNKHIIIDNTNLRESFINKWIDLVDKWNKAGIDHELDLKFKIFDNYTDIHELKDRISERDNLYHGALDYINKQVESFNNITKIINNKYKDKLI